MKLLVSIFLLAGLMLFGCSKGGDMPDGSKQLPDGEAKGDGEPGVMGGDDVGVLPGQENITPELGEGDVEKLYDPNDVPVLVERDGKFFQVYTIVKGPYTGKVVKFHPGGQMEASEKVYKEGVLKQHSEWHANGQKKMEAVYQSNGLVKTTYYDEEGNSVRGSESVKGAVGLGAAPGRDLEWTYGGGRRERRIDGYARATSGIIKKVFGDPDEDQNGVWVYKGMKVIAVQTGGLMTTVRFTISNDQVLSVSVEP